MNYVYVALISLVVGAGAGFYFKAYLVSKAQAAVDALKKV